MQERGLDPEIIRYLETPPTVDELTELLAQLGLQPRELIRKNEAAYRDLGLADDSLGDAYLIEAMAANPILIERPIVVHQGRAALGRPPEQVLDLF